MTVEQLIKHLKRMPPDADVVFVSSSDFGLYGDPVTDLATMTVDGKMNDCKKTQVAMASDLRQLQRFLSGED